MTVTDIETYSYSLSLLLSGAESKCSRASVSPGVFCGEATAQVLWSQCVSWYLWSLSFPFLVLSFCTLAYSAAGHQWHRYQQRGHTVFTVVFSPSVRRKIVQFYFLFQKQVTDAKIRHPEGIESPVVVFIVTNRGSCFCCRTFHHIWKLKKKMY